MANTSLKITSTTPQQKKITTSITYVNPNIKNSELKQLGQKLNALTNNTYEESTRIDQIDLDTASDKTTLAIGTNMAFRYRRYTDATTYTNEEMTAPFEATLRLDELQGGNRLYCDLPFTVNSVGLANTSRLILSQTRDGVTGSIPTINTYYNGNFGFSLDSITEPMVIVVNMDIPEEASHYAFHLTVTFIITANQ